MGRILAVFMLTSCAWAGELQKQVEALAAGHQGKVAFYAKNLKTGETVAIEADTPVQTASVIKLPIMLQVFAEVKDGKRSLSEKLTVTKENQVPGSGVLTKLTPGMEITLEDAVMLMITLSDNTATNMVIDAIGVPAVNARMQAMGLKDTVLYKKVFKPAEGPMPPEQKRFGLGKTTAREMARVMESVYRCELGEKNLCERMIAILKEQFYQESLPRYLSYNQRSQAPKLVANKTGALNDVRADVALVKTEAADIILSAFTYDNKDQRWMAENEAEVLLGRLGRAVLEAWAPR